MPRPFRMTRRGSLRALLAVLGDADGALGSGEGLVACQEAEALGLVPQQHGAQVAVAQAHVALLSHGAGHAESLQANADGLSSVGSGLARPSSWRRRSPGCRPSTAFSKAMGCTPFTIIIDIDALAEAQLPGLLEAGQCRIRPGSFSIFGILLSLPSNMTSLAICLSSLLRWRIILLGGRCTWQRRRTGRTGRCCSYRPHREQRRGGCPPASCPP